VDIELRGVVTGHHHQASAAGYVLLARCGIIDVCICGIVYEKVSVSINEGRVAHASYFVIDIFACLIRTNEEVQAIVGLVQ
jgi:hypothetical protein